MPIEDGVRPPVRTPPSARFLDVDFSLLSFDDVVAEIRRGSLSPEFAYVVTPNVDHVVKLFPKKPDARALAFQAAYDAAALCINDSRILQKLAALSGLQLPLVTGSDLTAVLFDTGAMKGCSVAIIGGGSDMIERLERSYPGPLYTQHIPPMGVIRNEPAQDAAVAFLQATSPQFTLFAIGAPQSEILSRRCLAKGGVTGIGLCIGASIEFLLGDQKRAPNWMQRYALEWAYRLASDPARLWRRYIVEGPKILRITLDWRRKVKAEDGPR